MLTGEIPENGVLGNFNAVSYVKYFVMPHLCRVFNIFSADDQNFCLLLTKLYRFIGNLGLCGQQVGEICKSQLEQPPINIVSLAAPPSGASDHLYGNDHVNQ